MSAREIARIVIEQTANGKGVVGHGVEIAFLFHRAVTEAANNHYYTASISLLGPAKGWNRSMKSITPSTRRSPTADLTMRKD
jgi:DNA-binding FadR family transcriptional regulator